jgi:Recombination endonuclease VII
VNRQQLRRMGMTVAEYHAAVETQQGWCAICLDREGDHIDHDHVTEEFRGLLCKQCNSLLGMANDSVWVLTQAIAYLVESRRGGVK